MPRWLVWCIASTVLWGVWMVAFTDASNAMPPLMVIVLSTLGLLPILIGLAFSKGVLVGKRRARGIAWGLVTGFCGTSGLIAYAKSLADGGPAATVGPLTAMSPLVTVILAALFLRERLNRVQVVGIAVALVAIFLFNMDPNAKAEAKSIFAPWLLSAIVALVLFGIAGISQKLSTNDISNELSTICYGIAAVIISVGIVATQKLDWGISGRAWVAVLGAGVLIGLALWVGFAAYRDGKASVVTALIALYPVVGVVLMVPILGEPMNAYKGVAIVLALLAGLGLTYDPPKPVEALAAK